MRNSLLQRKTLIPVALIFILILTGSCTATPIDESTLNKSIVQVWNGAELEASGIAIGDGSQILTVIDYEIFTPGNVNVITPDGDNYTAVIRQLDPRTGATLLSLGDVKLPPAQTSDAALITPNQNVTAAWYGQTYKNGIITRPELMTTKLIVNTAPGAAEITFKVHFPQEERNDLPYIKQGAVITDKKGVVLGLLGVDYNVLFTHPHGFGMLPGAVTINSALELLSPDFPAKPYANGPLMIVIAKGGATAFNMGYFTDYEMITEVLQETFSRTGAAIPDEELPENIYEIAISTKYGNAVTVAYARPVDLYSGDGTQSAQAKWVCIQWNRLDGKPNCLFYGDGRMALKGGYQMPDDLSELLEAINPLAYQ